MTDPLIDDLRRRADSAVPPSTLDLDSVLISSRRSLHRRRAAGAFAGFGAAAVLALTAIPFATVDVGEVAPADSAPPAPTTDEPNPSGVLLSDPTLAASAEVPPAARQTNGILPGTATTTEVAPGVIATVTPGTVARGENAWLADLGLGGDQLSDAAPWAGGPGADENFALDISWFDDDALLVRLAHADQEAMSANFTNLPDISREAREAPGITAMRSDTRPAVWTGLGADSNGEPETTLGISPISPLAADSTDEILWGATTRDGEELPLYDLGAGTQTVRVPLFSLDGLEEYRFFALRTNATWSFIEAEETPEGDAERP